jgi:hypothetical protein
VLCHLSELLYIAVRPRHAVLRPLQQHVFFSPSPRCSHSTNGSFSATERGASSTCTWDIFSGTGNGDGFLPPSIARTADLDAVVARLAHVEAYLKTLPPNLASFRPLAQGVQDTNYGDPNRKFIAGGGGAGVGREQGKEETFSDTEDAAVNLENGVFGGRLGGGGGEKKTPGARPGLTVGGTGGGMTRATSVRSLTRFGAHQSPHLHHRRRATARYLLQGAPQRRVRCYSCRGRAGEEGGVEEDLQGATE